MFTIQMPKFTDYQILIRPTKENGHKTVAMVPITDDDVKRLEENKSIRVTIKGVDYVFGLDNAYVAGEVNLEELKEICNKRQFLTDRDHAYIPSRYNFETHTCKSPKEKYLFTETVSTFDVVKYKYAALGKPKNIVIFRFKEYVVNR